MDVHFLPLSKSNIQSNELCVIAAICEKTGCLICPLVKNEPKVDPQQPQIGGTVGPCLVRIYLVRICIVRLFAKFLFSLA